MRRAIDTAGIIATAKSTPPGSLGPAIDAHSGHKGMDQDATYRTAREALGGDQLATFFVSGRLYGEIPEMLANMSGASELPANPFAGFGAGQRVPTWLMAGVRAEDDALVYDAVAGPTTGAAAASGAPASSAAGSPLPSLLTAPPEPASGPPSAADGADQGGPSGG